MFRYPSQGKLCFLAFKNFSPSFSSLIHCFTFCPHWSFSSTLSTPGQTSPGSQLHTELQSPVKTVEATHSAQAPWLSRLKPFPLSDSSCLFTLGPGSTLLLFSMYFCLATQKSKPVIRESPTHTERRVAWMAGGLAVSHKLLNPCTWAQIRGAGCGAREIARLINCANTRTRVQIPSIPVKGAVQLCTTEVSPQRGRQEAPWSSVAELSSQITELQVQWETLSLTLKVR